MLHIRHKWKSLAKTKRMENRKDTNVYHDGSYAFPTLKAQSVKKKNKDSSKMLLF